MRVYIDGKCVPEDRDIQFRSIGGENTRITALMFSNFHRGERPKGAPKDSDGEYTNIYACFDNLSVYKGLVVRNNPDETRLKPSDK